MITAVLIILYVGGFYFIYRMQRWHMANIKREEEKNKAELHK